MRVLLFGGSGMIGRGVLLECLAEPDVTKVLAIGRAPSGVSDPKVEDLVLKDLHDFSAVGEQLKGYDACFFCLGVSSAGMSEADYTKITYDLTVAAATAVRAASPNAVFCFVSGASTDSTEQKGAMWARVKGRAENFVLKQGFPHAYMFRPGLIQPMKGIQSRTAAYRIFYLLFAWLLPILKQVLPSTITTTERIGLAMINAVRKGYPQPILETRDINLLAGPIPGKIPLQL